MALETWSLALDYMRLKLNPYAEFSDSRYWCKPLYLCQNENLYICVKMRPEEAIPNSI